MIRSVLWLRWKFALVPMVRGAVALMSEIRALPFFSTGSGAVICPLMQGIFLPDCVLNTSV